MGTAIWSTIMHAPKGTNLNNRRAFYKIMKSVTICSKSNPPNYAHYNVFTDSRDIIHWGVCQMVMKWPRVYHHLSVRWLELYILWWRYQMETFSALLANSEGNSPVTGEFTAQRPMTRSLDVFFDLRLELTVEWTSVRLVIGDAIGPIHFPDRISLPPLVDLGVNPHIRQFFNQQSFQRKPCIFL